MKGSQIFGTKEMSTNEIIILASGMQDEGQSIENINEQIQLIDDLLFINKNKVIFNFHLSKTAKGYTRIRKNGFKDHLALIDAIYRGQLYKSTKSILKTI